MLAEVLAALDPQPGQIILDATLGAGGHAKAILEQMDGRGRLIGLDRDETMLEVARERLAPFEAMTTLVYGRFSRMSEVLEQLQIEGVDGVLMDLGISSIQLDDPNRGFSFQTGGTLDMRMDTQSHLTAGEIVNHWDQTRLADLIFQNGDERFSRRIARRIVEARRQAPIRTTDELARIVMRGYPRPPKGKRRRIHPATRTFQALRIAVNDEMGELDSALGQLADVVKPGGTAVVVSFHSLEDRRAKRTFAKHATGGSPWVCLGRRPGRPTPEEVRHNPRARSAKLRAAHRRIQEPPRGAEDGIVTA